MAALLGLAPAVLAVTFGVVGLRRASTVSVGRGNSITGVVLGSVALGIIVLTTVVWILDGLASSSSGYPSV